ncbi:potassium transporter TrkG [Paenibacillus sp. DMB5]|uniref:potassium transporter TrkG n=1 Tax=Paenibacillus sp. DMB5 TaxID=1780103 RepID=UPI000A3F8882
MPKIKIPLFVRNLNLTSSRIIFLGFAVPLIVGAILLNLPFSSSTGESVGWLNALFTSTSAICVTGLVVIDTGSDFSHFGQIVILFLIQLGGLGFMTYGVLIAVIMGRKIGLKERMLIQQSANAVTPQGVVRLSLISF